MPELRGKPRRSRVSDHPVPIAHQTPVKLTVRTRHPAPPAKRSGGKSIRKGKDAIDADGHRDVLKPGIALETRLRGSKEEVGKDKGQQVGATAMDEYDSGGRNGDKAPVAEDEATTTPLPEKVRLFIHGYGVVFDVSLIDGLALIVEKVRESWDFLLSLLVTTR